MRVDSLLNQQILPVLSQHMAAKQKPRSLMLGWSDEGGILLEFLGATER
ncbi:hypothetical protein [Pseudocitrobacter sp. RIT415]|nr:hypothetical protein [Pseudocitrobacter sp. RIT 415]